MAPADQPIFPIRELSAYHSRWTIRARVTNKTPMRTFSKGPSGGGKVFSVDLLDAEGGEIRASFFNQAADLNFEKLLPGKVFTFSRGQAKIANRQFNPCNHRYELTFDKDAIVEEATEGEKIEEVKFNLVGLNSVSSRTVPCRVDICGVVTAAKPVLDFQSREGKSLTKREITVADDTSTSIEVALWGEHARIEDAKFEGNPIVALKGVLVKEWNGGRGGSLGDAGTLQFTPALPEAGKVQQWWAEGGASAEIVALSVTGGGAGLGSKPLANISVKNLQEVRAACDRLGDKPEVFTTVARLGMVQLRKQGEPQQQWYNACAEIREGSRWPCHKRVDESGFCQSCGKHGKVTVRVASRCKFADFSDSVWFTTFHDAAQRVLGMTGEELKALDQEDLEKTKLESMLKERYFTQPFQLTLRARQDTYNGEVRANIVCADGRPVPYAEHGRKLLHEVREMLTGQVPL